MEYREFMEIYHTEHYCCPVCHSKNYSATLAGYFYDPTNPKDYVDNNSCHCYTCGWHGVVHQLVPKPEKTAFKIGILEEHDICQNYDNKLYTIEEARKMVDELEEKDRENYYYCYEVEIYQDIK